METHAIHASLLPTFAPKKLLADDKRARRSYANGMLKALKALDLIPHDITPATHGLGIGSFGGDVYILVFPTANCSRSIP